MVREPDGPRAVHPIGETMMKKLLLTALALLFALGLSACKDKAAKVVNPEERDWSNKDIVIWVDESGIPLGELRAEMHRQMLHMPQGLSEDQTKAYQARATQISIENLIVRRLLERELDRSGILIPQSEVDEAKKVLEAGLGEGRTLTMLIAEVNLPMDVLEANLRLDLFKNKVLSNEFATAWAAKWEGQKNLTIAIKVKGKVIAGFSIANGYQKTDEDYEKHGSIKKISIYHDAVTEANKVGTFEINKQKEVQYFPFDKLLRGAGKLFCRIEEVYEGEAASVSASEFRVWGN